MKDKAGRDITVGDIVVYTGVGAGKNLPPLEFGEVVNLTKAGVTVIPLNNDFTRKQVEDYDLIPTGQYLTWRPNEEIKRRVPNGRFKDASPVNVRNYGSRFYIIGRI